MRERITNDSVAYFVNTLVPLSQRLFDRKIKATEGGRAAEAKVWEVLIGQIWDCLPGFLDLARDLREVSVSAGRRKCQSLTTAWSLLLVV